MICSGLDDNGNMAGALSSGDDITAQKRAQETLLRSNKIFIALVDWNQALPSSHDEEKLLEDMCRIIFEKGAIIWHGTALSKRTAANS